MQILSDQSYIPRRCSHLPYLTPSNQCVCPINNVQSFWEAGLNKTLIYFCIPFSSLFNASNCIYGLLVLYV